MELTVALPETVAKKAQAIGLLQPEVLERLFRDAIRRRQQDVDGRIVMKRTDVTYGQLDKALRSLGFSCRVLQREPHSRVYEHKETGALLTVPPFPMTDFALPQHLVAARGIVDLFGIAEPTVFDTKVRKAG
jgi:hypothetical protein